MLTGRENWDRRERQEQKRLQGIRLEIIVKTFESFKEKVKCLKKLIKWKTKTLASFNYTNYKEQVTIISL